MMLMRPTGIVSYSIAESLMGNLTDGHCAIFNPGINTSSLLLYRHPSTDRLSTDLITESVHISEWKYPQSYLEPSRAYIDPPQETKRHRHLAAQALGESDERLRRSFAITRE